MKRMEAKAAWPWGPRGVKGDLFAPYITGSSNSMKTQRRHELKENDLSHALEATLHYLDQHGTRIGLIALVVVAVVAGTSLTVQSKSAAIEDSWRRKGELSFTDPEKSRESVSALRNLIESSNDKSFVLAGLLDLGQQSLRLAGEGDVGPDRELNDEARKAFEELLSKFGNNPMAIGVSHLGLATVEENMFSFDRDDSHKINATRHLKIVAEDPALDGIPFKRIAMDRLKAIDTTFTIVHFVEPPGPVSTPEATESAIQPQLSIENTPFPTATTTPPAGDKPADGDSAPGDKEPPSP